MTSSETLHSISLQRMAKVRNRPTRVWQAKQLLFLSETKATGAHPSHQQCCCISSAATKFICSRSPLVGCMATCHLHNFATLSPDDCPCRSDSCATSKMRFGGWLPTLVGNTQCWVHLQGQSPPFGSSPHKHGFFTPK